MTPPYFDIQRFLVVLISIANKLYYEIKENGSPWAIFVAVPRKNKNLERPSPGSKPGMIAATLRD